MRILLTGATGFIGRALVPALLRDGHVLVAWARSPERAASLLGAEVEICAAHGGERGLSAALAGCDAIVNLAGERIIGPRWTPERKQALAASRVGLSEQLVRVCAAAASRPRVLVSASAVGVYGDRGDEPLTERSAPGRGFLAELATRWEAAARGADALGTRVVLLRTGIVLGRDGGALAPLVPLFTMGLGGPQGSGDQYMPWIHLHDAVRVIAHALDDARYAGPINVVAPEERTNREVAQAIGRALDRPAVLPAPAALLRVGLGESAEALLGSQRVQPQRLLELGFTFAFPALDAALADVAGADGIQMGALSAPPAAGSLASAEYLYRHQPRFELRTSAALNAPLEAAFRFFSNARNLGLITPASMAFRFDGPPAELADGVRLDYRIRVGPVPMRWRTHIVSWEPPRRFVDVQEHGPYHSWWHEHVFRADGDRTIVEDRVCYAPPLPGAAGNLVNQVVVAPLLRRIFAYRGDVIRRRFNEAS